MVSFFRRLLRLLGFNPRSSRRPSPRVDTRYTYERDEKGRLLRRGPGGVERLDYETWHPVERPESARTRKKREKYLDTLPPELRAPADARSAEDRPPGAPSDLLPGSGAGDETPRGA